MTRPLHHGIEQALETFLKLGRSGRLTIHKPVMVMREALWSAAARGRFWVLQLALGAALSAIIEPPFSVEYLGLPMHLAESDLLWSKLGRIPV